jgi:hypothetical protein
MIFRLSNAGILGNEIAIRREPCNRHDSSQLKICFLRFEPAVFMPEIVFERNSVTRFRVQVARGPIVENDWRN